MSTIRRISETPARYGTREISLGDVVDVSPETADELVADGGWEIVTSPVQTSADEPAEDTSPSSTHDSATRSRKRDR